jgi:hypothetical protein
MKKQNASLPFLLHFYFIFSASSVLSVAKTKSVKSVKSVVNFSLCLGALVAETQLVRRSLGEGGSIKNNKLCETNPISEKVKCL